MYARSTTFQARPEAIDAGIAHVNEEVLPAISRMEGCVGLSLLVDRQSGRCIATSAWESEDAMRATDEQLQPVRERVAEIVGGTPQVEEWEIAILHRDHRTGPGACVRATWVQMDPAGVDRAIDIYKVATLPELEGLQGFCSASLLVNRATGRAVSSVTYDSRQAMENTRERAKSVRSSSVQEMRAEVLDIGEFDLALAHLHVPEMA